MVSSGIEHKIKHLYEKNRRTSGEYSYTIPSSDTYPYQWLWDSCFASIALSYFDIEQAKRELYALTSKQFENGMIPHIIYWHRTNDLPQLNMQWGKRHTSSITQPPLLAEAVKKIYDTDHDIEFVRQMLPHIHAFHQFFYRHRDPRKSGVIGIINPDESGEDTSPRFDMPLSLPDKQTFEENYGSRMELLKDWREARFVVKKRMDLKHWVRDVSFNIIFLRSLEITAHLAMVTGESAIAEWSHTKAVSTKKGIITHLKDESGFFLSSMDYGEMEQKIAIKTWNLFMPLYGNLVSHDEAADLVSLLYDPDMFATPYGVPTVSLNEPTFNLSATWPWPNWRGPIWLGANWFIIKGLKNYGYDKEVAMIKEQSFQLVKKSGFREFYNPFSGEGYGATGFIWAGLLLDM